MTHSIQKLDREFPIFLIKNFESPDDNFRKSLVSLVIECKKKNHNSNFGSFIVDLDINDFFENLYQNFFELSKNLFGKFTSYKNNYNIWSYSSNKYQHGAIPGTIHNHINTSTINSVYYLNIPESVTYEKGSITFFEEEREFTYKPNNNDLLIFPNYLDHRINNYNTDENWRVSINMEIKCEESADELFSRIDT